MLDCDHVFMVLTRGPFPTGSRDDAAVESHLLRCSGCRELAEALRPAPQFCHEAVSPEESRYLPGYRSGQRHHCELGAFELRVGNALPRVTAQPPRRDTDVVAKLLWFAGAVLFGVMLAGTLTAIVGPTGSQDTPSSATLADDALDNAHHRDDEQSPSQSQAGLKP